MGGCISRLITRLPTTEELENCQWLQLTGDQEWDPYSPLFQENEQRTQDTLSEPHSHRERTIFAFCTNPECATTQILSSFGEPLCEHEMHQSILNLLRKIITYQSACQIGSTTSGPKGTTITKEELASKWNISKTAAEQTLRVTTQKGI